VLGGACAVFERVEMRMRFKRGRRKWGNSFKKREGDADADADADDDDEGARDEPSFAFASLVLFALFG
jgi:hypothetical protein